MINRPILLNLFKKASTPQETIKYPLCVSGDIPVTNWDFTQGKISLSPIVMQSILSTARKDATLRVNADFSGLSGTKFLPLLAVMSPNNLQQTLWKIHIPKALTTSFQVSGQDVFIQESQNSNVFNIQK